jgi:predicted GNAT family acetyltransferase
MSDAVKISDNKERGRYEVAVDGGTAFVTYRLSGNSIALLHAEVPRHLRGQGIGERMVDAVMADIRRRGLKAVPYCSFVAGYLAEHPEYSDLLA